MFPAPRELVAKRLDRVRARSDEHKTRVDDGSRECGALGQEAVTRVHGFGASLERRLDDRVRAEIALGGRRWSEPHRDIGRTDMQRVRIRVGVHGNGFDPEVPGRPDDAHGDLAAVRDEDPLEGSTVLAQRHRARRRSRGRGHSGMLPCFFGGFVSRLSASISRAAIRRGLVSDGRMTSSTYPRAAAAYGLAKRSS